MQLCHAKAHRVVAVEGLAENFVKCCVVKNVFSLDRATFVLDRIENVCRETYGQFDVCLASGVLYHLANPARVLARLAELSPVIMVWTHLGIPSYPRGRQARLERQGHSYRGKWYREPATNRAGFEARSFWPFLEDLRRMFYDSGYSYVDEISVDWEHFQGVGWLGTLWRDKSLKPADSLWRDASLLTTEPPTASPAVGPLRRLGRTLLPAPLRRSIRERFGR